MALASGASFAGYTVARGLGSGVTGEVYLAQDPRSARWVALKVLSPQLSSDERIPAAIRDRDRPCRQRLSPAHRGGACARRVRRTTVDRDGLRRGQQCRATDGRALPGGVTGRRGARDHHRRRVGSRPCPPPRAAASRRQTRQHLADRSRCGRATNLVGRLRDSASAAAPSATPRPNSWPAPRSTGTPTSTPWPPPLFTC